MRRLHFIVIIGSFLIAIFSASINAQESHTDLYKVGVDDVIEIIVQDYTDLRTIATVTSGGTINFPFIGTVYVKDKMVSEIEKEIQEALADGYIKFPVVTVSLARSLSKKIYVYGELGRVGQLPFEEGMTIMRALSIAGGISNQGLYGKIKLKRKQKGKFEYKDISIGLKSTIENSSKGDMLLEQDDILIVETSKKFFIYGEIARPGEYVLEKDMSVIRALSVAGGVRPDGLYGTVKLRRKQKNKSEYEDIVIDLQGTIKNTVLGDTLLQADDILIVERNRTYFANGELNRTGEFVLEKDMTVLRAISIAGGIRGDGLYGKIKLRRRQSDGSGYEDIEINLENTSEGDILLQADDILIVERNKTFFLHGEANRPGEYVLEKDMTVMRAISIAGGIKGDGLYGKVKLRRKQSDSTGYEDIEINLREIVEGNVSDDILIQPNDILIIERNKTFLLYGEINKPGEYVLQYDMTVFRAITIAGGLTKWGSENRVEVLRRTEGNFRKIKVNINDVIKGDSSADILLKPNDVVIVSAGIL